MACGPCIRGHRSTKCQHHGERLLVPVRKPGRPLSVCPHPTDKACGCGVVTAAIPRSKKCGCGTSSHHELSPEQLTVKSEVASIVPDSKSPTSPTKRHFSIQKSTSKPATKIDPSLLERTDSAYMNVRPAPAWSDLGMPPNGNGFMMGMPSPETPVTFTPPVTNGMVNGFHHPTAMVGVPYNGHGYVMTATTQQQVIPVSLAMVTPGLMSADQGPRRNLHQRNGSMDVLPPINTSNGSSGSCCAPKTTPHHSPSSSTNSDPAPPTKSCCSSSNTAKPEIPAPNGGQLGVKTHIRQAVNGEYVNGGAGDAQHLHGVPITTGAAASPIHAFGPSLHPEMVFPAGFYHQPPGPQIYTYPPSYGTMQSPLLPAQWRQTMSAHYAMGAPHQHRVPQEAAIPHYHHAEAGHADGGGVSHACSCGDSCNCLGCPAHPYNEATQGMVRSAMSSMLEDGIPHGGGSNGAAVAPGTAPSSPTPVHTPASEKSEDQVQVPSSDFFFVSYPNLCDGAENTCPCGDDCQCLGCFFHGNTGGLNGEDAGAAAA